MKIYIPNSDSLCIVFIQYSLVFLHYFLHFYLVWRHKWRHRGLLVSSTFFFDNFWSNWDIESREGHHCAGTEIKYHLIWNFLVQSMTWGGGNVILSSGSTLNLTFTEQKVYHWKRLDETITMVADFASVTTSGGGMSQKPTKSQFKDNVCWQNICFLWSTRAWLVLGAECARPGMCVTPPPYNSASGPCSDTDSR